MAIDFEPARWDAIRRDYTAWWNGELRRPLVSLTCGGHDPGRAAPALAACRFTAQYDWTVGAEAIVDRWDYDLSRQYFLGDAFPCVWPNFGAGVIAAFLGCEADVADDTVWFNPLPATPLRDLHLRLEPGNRWYKRVSDIVAEAARRWQGGVQVAMTDLGGNLDILASCRSSEALLFDLLDDPQEVKRLVWEAHEAWWHCFDELDRIQRHVNPGYTAWTQIFSNEPYYMLQCDFAYMIGPTMFDAFVKPELAACCRRLKHGFYHLDGIGQLPHLDSLLSIPELRGIQWIPGAGQPDQTHWPDVYRRIRKAGKLAQIHNGDGGVGWRSLDIIAEQLGSAEGLILIGNCAPDERREVDAFLKRHGARQD